MPNFKSQGFKMKEIYMYVLVLSFYSDIYWSRWLGGFLPLTAAKFRLVWKISDQSIKTCHLLSHTLIKFSIFVVCGSVYTNYFTRHYGDSSKDPERRNRENENVLKRCDLKFGMHVVKTLFYFMKPTDYTYYTYFLIF